VPGPWSQRVWVVPVLTALCWPEQPHGRRRQKPSVAGGRQRLQPGRRGLPDRRLVVVVEGGLAAVALARAWVQNRGAMVARWRWDAARDHPPGPPPPGQRGPNPPKGKRPRRLQGWAARSDPPGERVEVDWDGGERQQLWGCSRPARWDPPGVPPVAMRSVVGADPDGKRRLAAFCCPDLAATPVEILPWIVMRWAREVTCAEARAHVGVGTPRHWADPALARTTPVRLALLSLVTVLAWQLRPGGQLPGAVTAWSHTAAPTCADGLPLVRGHRWRARYWVTAAPEAAIRQFPQAAFALLLHGVPLAA
jgi:hypothetical protein